MAATHGFRAAFASSDPEQGYITVVHFLAHSGAGNTGDLATVLSSGAFPTAIAKTLFTTGHINLVTVTNIRDHGDTTPPDQDAHAMSVAGGLTAYGGTVPRGLCGLVDLHTNVSGRGTHGWSYGFPLYSNGAMTADGKFVSSVYLTALNAEATALNGVLTVSSATDDYDLAVFSRARWARGEASFLFSVKAVTASPKVRMLRKRNLF